MKKGPVQGRSRASPGSGGPLRIALALPAAHAFIERMWLGALDYARRVGGWRMTMNPEGGGVSLPSLRGWDGDGVFAFIETRADAQAARGFRCPVVNLSSRIRVPDLLTVGSDNYEIGRLAAIHLREKGFERFGFYGLRTAWYSRERLRGFRDGIGRGGEITVLRSPGHAHFRGGWEADRAALEAWLVRLIGAGPAGVLCVHDYRAIFLLETALRLGITVPEKLAVLGVNDDPVACAGCLPALSSVPQDGFAIGVLAARLLDQWISSGVRPPQPAGILPLRVVERASTDSFGVEEPRIRGALEFIENSLSRSFGVEEVARSVGVSRRWLEHRFLDKLGLTPRAYIVRRRLRRVEILRTSQAGISAADLALQSGFSGPRALRAAQVADAKLV